MKTRSLRFLAVAAGLSLALAAAPAAPVLAGDAMLGKTYENKLVGFRFKPLNDWTAVPPGTNPDDPKIGSFYTEAAKFDHTVNKPKCDLYAFKKAKGEGTSTPDDEGTGDDPKKGPTADDLRKAMAEGGSRTTRSVFDDELKEKISNADAAMAGVDEKKKKKMMKDLDMRPPVEKQVKDGDRVITMIESDAPYALTNGRDTFIEGAHLVAAWISNDEYEVGVFYAIPSANWKKYDNGVYASAKSLTFLTGEDVAAARQDLADALAGKTGDERWLEEIKRKVGPGWAYLQTKNYLLVYDKAVKPDRVHLIAVQIEAIRKDVYEVMFPPDRPVTAISVVRICKDKQQYMGYGGSSQSAGYWYWVDQELVFYEDTSAKADSLRVLNHEAFHQYIFYSVGSIAPHDWFNEGHGDYFSGHDFNSNGKFVAHPFSWRQDIKGIIGAKKYIPLKTFMSYTHEQYYGPLIGQNYSQGWSVIWFMRRTRNPEWKGMLETYFKALKGAMTIWMDDQVAAAKKDGSWNEKWKPPLTPPDVESAARQKAYDSIFGGWDDKKWERFEKEWKETKF